MAMQEIGGKNTRNLWVLHPAPARGRGTGRDELQPALQEQHHLWGSFTQIPLLGGLETSEQRLAASQQRGFAPGSFPWR